MHLAETYIGYLLPLTFLLIEFIDRFRTQTKLGFFSPIITTYSLPDTNLIEAFGGAFFYEDQLEHYVTQFIRPPPRYHLDMERFLIGNLPVLIRLVPLVIAYNNYIGAIIEKILEPFSWRLLFGESAPMTYMVFRSFLFVPPMMGGMFFLAYRIPWVDQLHASWLRLKTPT